MRRVIKSKPEARLRRAKRTRARVFGTKDKPRLSVARSLKYVYLQLIDDASGRTLLGLSSRNLKKIEAGGRRGKVAQAYAAGRALGEKALELGIKEARFDRGGRLYHGRVAAAAEGARDGGLRF